MPVLLWLFATSGCGNPSRHLPSCPHTWLGIEKLLCLPTVGNYLLWEKEIVFSQRAIILTLCHLASYLAVFLVRIIDVSFFFPFCPNKPCSLKKVPPLATEKNNDSLVTAFCQQIFTSKKNWIMKIKGHWAKWTELHLLLLRSLVPGDSTEVNLLCTELLEAVHTNHPT